MIENFRGLRNIEIELSDYSTLIGANNTGKSSILKAIEIFLNQGKFIDDDWYEKNFENQITIECIFNDIQEWERTVPGIAGIIQNNLIRLRLTCSYDINKNKPETPCYEAFCEPEEIQGWSEKWGDITPELQAIIQTGCPGANGNWWKTKANKEVAKTYLREHHGELITRGTGQWSREGISIDAALKQAIPQAVLIPASSDFSSDIKTTSKTPFGQLIETIVMPAVRGTPEFLEFEGSVTRLITRIRGENDENHVPELRELTRSLTERLSSIILNTEVILTMNAPEIHKIVGGGASIKIRDGVETSLEYQGHGTQRALIFALIETIAKKNALHPVEEGVTNDETRQKPTIILFEEPELYLHPHLMRRLKSSLAAISSSSQWQVLSSTHSPFLIDVANEPRSLIILKKGDDRNVVKSQILEDLYQREIFQGEREMLRALLDFNPTVCEAFFAENVVLVEGDTEVAALSLAKEIVEKANTTSRLIDSTTVVSCDGKWTIPAIAKILRRLGVNIKVIHDKDAKGRTPEELLALTGFNEYCANSKILEIIGDAQAIYVVDDTFEHVLWTEGESPTKDKPFNSWKKIKEILAEDQLNNYPKLKEIITFVYNVQFVN